MLLEKFFEDINSYFLKCSLVTDKQLGQHS